ncbi:MAG: ferredoxin [Armatimonadetes bacterium]|nr:ferredoxin [Armatimonadota bacterium]
MPDKPERLTRREFLPQAVRGIGLLATGGALGALATRRSAGELVWQIDPRKCVACEHCATDCVLSPSAVKVMHEYRVCGYCNRCFAYFVDQPTDDTTAAENQRCPTNAIRRSFVEDPYHQYAIDEPKCIGCGICVKGCKEFGNGSLILQIRHDRCVNCNQCAIATACPAQAVSRVRADQPYILRRSG